MFTVIERRPISDELALASEEWLTRNRLTEVIDESWLELVCEDGGDFNTEELLLHLAVPACEVSPGDSLDAGRTQTVGRLWPEPDAPPGAVPRHLALARTIERRDGTWFAACELPGPVRELFTVERPDAMLSVMTATRRTLGSGALSISGDPSGRLSFTIVEGNMAAWGTTEARVPEAFTYWLDSGPAMELTAPLRDATSVVGSLGALDDLIIANDQKVEARCRLDEPRPGPVQLAEDYFETDARSRVEGLRVDREGGLGREALAAIANLRPGKVTLTVADDGGLVISGGAEGADPFKVVGPGFSTREDRRNVPIVVPYLVALALHDGAKGATVELTVDAEWGRLHRDDQGITVQWQR